MGGDGGEFRTGEVVEEGEMGGDEVAFGREIALAEGLEVLLGSGFEGEGENEGLAGHRVTLTVNK